MSTQEPVDDVALVWPGTWHFIPLGEDGPRRAAVERIVKHTFAGLDDQPIARRQLRQSLVTSTDRARAAGGRQMALWDQVVGAVPVSASVTTYWLELGDPAAPSHLDDLLAVLAREDAEAVQGADREREEPTSEPAAPRRSPDPRTVGRADVARSAIAAGPLVRRVRRAVGGAGQLDEAGEVEQLLVDYWIELPAGRGLVQVCCSTPMVAWTERMVSLFDAIVGTATWTRRRSRVRAG